MASARQTQAELHYQVHSGRAKSYDDHSQDPPDVKQILKMTNDLTRLFLDRSDVGPPDDVLDGIASVHDELYLLASYRWFDLTAFPAMNFAMPVGKRESAGPAVEAGRVINNPGARGCGESNFHGTSRIVDAVRVLINQDPRLDGIYNLRTL